MNTYYLDMAAKRIEEEDGPRRKNAAKDDPEWENILENTWDEDNFWMDSEIDFWKEQLEDVGFCLEDNNGHSAIYWEGPCSSKGGACFSARIGRDLKKRMPLSLLRKIAQLRAVELIECEDRHDIQIVRENYQIRDWEIYASVDHSSRSYHKYGMSVTVEANGQPGAVDELEEYGEWLNELEADLLDEAREWCEKIYDGFCERSEYADVDAKAQKLRDLRQGRARRRDGQTRSKAA